MMVPIILFAIAATGGLVLVALRMRGENPPLVIAMAHGALAASGLVALALPVLSGQAGGQVRTAFILFVVAALGGFFLLSFHLRKKLIPLPVAAVHALLAVTAFGLLLLRSAG